MHACRRIFCWTTIVMVGAGLFGCASSQAPGTAGYTDQQSALMENPAEQVRSLDQALMAARNNRVDILSPDWFARAEQAFLRASEDLKKGNAITDIQDAVRTGRSALGQAEAVAPVSRTALADAIKARDRAIDAGAMEFKDAFEDAEADFLDLARAVEKNDLQKAQKGQEDVVRRYDELEIRGIKAAAIGDVRRLLHQAEESGARKLAPESYAGAVERLDAADAFISANPHAGEKIQQLADAARFEANRLLAITDAAAGFKTATPEAIALLQEERLSTIAAALGAQDMRNQSTATQMDNIVGSIEALRNDRDFVTARNQTLQSDMEQLRHDYQSRIDALNVQVATLEGKSREDQMAKERMARERMAAEQRLAAEMRFNKLYTTVQGYFESQEAEVYKQENQLVIRLKAMHFPVGKSIIMPDNYALLSKVQKAIRTFEDPRVVVEGHTDATGSVDVNMRLSQARADAVREYLIANQTLAPDRISAVGYGADRPLASNATAAGRAINRRIDILIIPRARPI